MPQQTPEIPAAPALTPHQVTVNGAPIASAYDVYQAFRAQRRVLGNQMEGLQNDRDNISRELQQEGVTGADRKGLEQRMSSPKILPAIRGKPSVSRARASRSTNG